MQKNKGSYEAAEDYNDDYNPGENYGIGDEYDTLEDKWYEIQDEYRDRYPDVTDSDVYYGEDRFGSMLENLGRRRGRIRREIQAEIENW